jgi:hypothetical protein
MKAHLLFCGENCYFFCESSVDVRFSKSRDVLRGKCIGLLDTCSQHRCKSKALEDVSRRELSL